MTEYINFGLPDRVYIIKSMSTDIQINNRLVMRYFAFIQMY